MNYSEAIEYIHNTPKFSRVLGNDMLRALLLKLGNPHKEQKYIHIAGTNGKGSVAVMTDSILRASGLKTGLFTSPYIEVFNERIKVNGENIPDDELAGIVTYVKDTIEQNDTPVSEFALDLACALIYFKKMNCDIVILETGLGGRLDATNVTEEKLLSVITSVSLDHTEYLGDTIEEIATEKAAIIKNSAHTVLYANNPSAVLDIVEHTCKENGSTLHISDKAELRYGCLMYGGIGINLPLAGSYQLENAMCAIKCAEVLRDMGYDISDNSIYEGISSVKWPVRFEYMNERLIIDGAHNPDAIEKLTDELINIGTPILPVIAMMSDKAVEDCADIIASKFERVITTQIDMPRCMSAEELKSIFDKKNISAIALCDAAEAVKTALNTEATVCVFGSLYLAGQIRSIYK